MPCQLIQQATNALFLVIRHPPAALTINQPAVLFSQNKSAPSISHQPTERAARCNYCTVIS
jgi:hypothetical protein